MRKVWLSVAGVAALVLGGAALGQAGPVNCGIVNKDLQMGRTPQDISERMMISVDDVKKCEAEAKKDAAPAAAPAAADKAKAAGEANHGAH
jgi:hypothetical protein